MNLPQLALLLDSVRLCDVSYAPAVLATLNSTLTPPHLFKIDSTGSDLFTTFDALPPALRNHIRSLVLLTPAEVLVVKADIDCVKESHKRRQSRYDAHTSAWGMYAVLLMLALAMAVVLQYVFDVTSNDDVLSGHMVVAVKYIFRYFFE